MSAIIAFHVALYGNHVPDKALQLYKAYDELRFRGVSDRELDAGRLQAALVLLLHEIQKDPELDRVYLFTPKSHKEWVLAKIRQLAAASFRLRKGNKPAIVAIMDAFAKIEIGHRPSMIRSNSKWASFGFVFSDVLLPPWFSNRLVLCQS